MKILIADDHALFRAGLRLLLSSLDSSPLLLEAASLPEATAVAQRHSDLTLCLLDLQFDGENGLTAFNVIKQAAPDVAIVVISAASDLVTVRACLEAGAMSFVPKSVSPETLTLALQKVLAGHIYLPDEVLHHAREAAVQPNLSPRQMDVLRGLARGLPTKSIARELGISEHTAKEHIGLIFQALGAHNRTEAVIMAARLGWPHAGVSRGQ
ncbi:MAG: response regulator transcription factor [Variovorax sp.]|nr:MAG: response regulator transcription factor [Variovorax sp.]